MEEVSNFKVPLTTVLEILPHPNAERLEFARVYDFLVIVGKGQYKIGDAVIYVPVDSILPHALEAKLFPADSKIKLHRSRVRQIKIRKAYSQGMLISPKDLHWNGINVLPVLKQEENLAEILGIGKYEPPASGFAGNPPGTRKLHKKKRDNPNFRKYNGVANIKWMPHAFREEEVVIQEKIHGSHIRFGKAPVIADTLWKKLKKLLGVLPKFENVYGSNNVDISTSVEYSGFYGVDIYGKLLEKEKAFEKVKDGEFWHGELYGPGVQDNYTYGLQEHSLVVFDVRVMLPDNTQKWLNPEESEALAKERGFHFVPVLHRGAYSKETLAELTSGPSILDPNTKVREGVVIKSRFFYDKAQNKDALKSINPEYLNDSSNSDHH